LEKLNFNNTAIAFAHKTDKELKKAHLLFKMFKYPVITIWGPKLAKVGLDLGLPIKGILRQTIFSQFCGGETIEDCQTTCQQLSNSEIGSILDYSAEGEENEANFDFTLQETLRTIEFAKKHSYISFCVFKVTGIARFGLLEKWNNQSKLTEAEEAEKQRIINRFDTICKMGFENKIKILVDAEETWIQDVIDELAIKNMRLYNTEKAYIYNTIQHYRKDRLAFLQKCIAEANGNHFKLGVKLVRGAYMEKERARAKKMGYPSPIQEGKAESDKDYNKALKVCMENIENVALVAGTHNQESTYLLTEMMTENGIDKNDDRIWFSQLLGMSDNISFNLSKARYNVCKYVPYGPVKKLLPYLSRRAQENSSVKGQSSRELSLIEEELKRRHPAYKK